VNAPGPPPAPPSPPDEELALIDAVVDAPVPDVEDAPVITPPPAPPGVVASPPHAAGKVTARAAKRMNHRGTEDTVEEITKKSLCPLCPLWLKSLIE
jgi:hypothetical protein